jgi:predicted TPR repeat methyltransferase
MEAELYFKKGINLISKDKYIKAISCFEKVLDIDPEYIEAIYNLGLANHRLGNLDKAVRIYKKLVAIDPIYAVSSENKILSVIYFFSIGKINDALIILNKLIDLDSSDALLFNMLGGCHASLGQTELAVTNYRKALEYQPDYAIPQHMINSLTGHTSKEPPKEYVKNLFDDYAEKFNESLVGGLQYNLPFIIKDLITSLNDKKFKYDKTIDLGCGTGLSGRGLSEISNNLTGIDISENMISEAKKLHFYDNLVVEDIVEFLDSSHNQYDLFVALDVLIYIGDAELFIKSIIKCCKPNSLVVFSIEVQKEKGYSLLRSSRYAHSDEYIINLFKTTFDLLTTKNVKLRKEGASWIDGKIYAFKVS